MPSMKNESNLLSSSKKKVETFDLSMNHESTEETSISLNSSKFEEFIDNNKVTKFNFKSLKSCDALYYDDISADDEVWLVQCPKNTSLSSLEKINLDVNSDVSRVKCRINGVKEKLTVYSVEDFPSHVNLALPDRSTKSFRLKVTPVAGQLIFQKNINAKRKNDESECSVIDEENIRIKSEPEYDEKKYSECLTSKKKRRNL